MGHFAVACRFKQASTQELQIDPAQEDPEEDFWIEAITCPDNSPPWEIELNIGENKIKFKIDRGADISVLTRDCYNELKDKPPIMPTSVNLMSPGGKVNTEGECTIKTTYRSQPYRFRAIVVQGSKNNLLSLKINTQKTEALWLGDVPPFKLPNNIKWSNKPLNVLGAYIGWNLQEANRLTISKKDHRYEENVVFLETQEIKSERQSAYPEKLSNFPDHTPGKLTSISR